MKSPSRLVLVHAPLHGAHLPRQVLRPLGAKPLLEHAIGVAAGVTADRGQIVVVTDDDEVALLAERQGCSAIVDSRARGTGTAESLLSELSLRRMGDSAEIQEVLLLKPTAPLIVPADIDAAHEILLTGGFDSVLSATDETHHAWMRVDGRYVPDFVARRGEGDGPLYRETGAFILTRSAAVRVDRFVGLNVGLSLVPRSRAIDITSPHEWWVCERLLQRRRIVFVVAGNTALGMGHIYRAQQLAHEIVNHEVSFVCLQGSDLAADVFRTEGYSAALQRDEPLSDLVLALTPDLVINDFLDTTECYVRALRSAGVRVVNFEDLGEGARTADLVINELFMQDVPAANHRVGHEFFCIREEFLSVSPRPFTDRVSDVLITFGGTDSADLTLRTLEAIWPEAEARNIRVTVVVGPGYQHLPRLDGHISSLKSSLIRRANGTKRMSDFMAGADLAISSAGRTLFELATMRVPAIVIASNEREETHPFASSHAGFRYIGPQDSPRCMQLLRDNFLMLLGNPTARRNMRATLEGFDFRLGKKRVLAELSAVLGAPLN